MLNYITRHKVSSFLIGCIFCLLSFSGLKSLTFDNDYRSFLGADNATLTDTDWLSERRGDGNETLVLIYKPGEGDIFNTLNLLQYSEIAEAASAHSSFTF